MRDAGIIGFVPRGEYSDTETYDFLQFVYYEGSTYVAKKETTGNPPAENNEFWQILAKGKIGDYLPLTGGTITRFLNIKSGYFPLLNLIRTQYGQSAAIQLTCGSETQDGILLEGTVDASDSEGARFQIRDRISQKVLLSLSSSKKEVFDPKTNAMKPIMVQSDAAFQPGESFAIKGDTPFAGYVTTGGTAIFFSIPLPKSAAGRTVSVSCKFFRVRGVQGYIVNQEDIADYLVERTVVSENLLQIVVRKKDLSAYDNAVNNTPVGVDGPFTISFS